MGSLKTYDIVYGFGFDVEKTSITMSGYMPADPDMNGRWLFSRLRLVSFAAMIHSGFTTKFVAVGGNEKRYKDDVPAVNQARIIKRMLEMDYGIESGRIEALPSEMTTLGNIAAIREHFGNIGSATCAGVSSHYHLPRIAIDLRNQGLDIPLYSAEQFLFLGSERWSVERLSDHLGGGPFADTTAKEIRGMSLKLTDEYGSGLA